MEILRVHYCLDKPRDDRRCRARCGHWVAAPHYTDDHAQVTCKACRKLLALPSTSKAPAMNKLSSILALILLAACDTDGFTTTSSTGSSPEGSSSDTLETSGSGDSTGDESTGGSTGEGSTGDTSGSGSEGMGSGGMEACWADECGEDLPCGKNLACLPHPINGAMVCASSNCDPSAPCDGLTSACPVTIPQGVCILNETKHGWCYPQICVAVGDCAAGSDCVNGYCY